MTKTFKSKLPLILIISFCSIYSGNSFLGIENSGIQNLENTFQGFDEYDMILEVIKNDTLPSNTRSRKKVKINDDGEKLLIIFENGEVIKLKINDEVIAKENYNDYAAIIEEHRTNEPQQINNNIFTTPNTPKPPSTSGGLFSNTDVPSPPPVPGHLPVGNELSDRFAAKLYKDGLIDTVKDFKVKLTFRKMKVNGKNQPNEVHQRYLKFYESETGHAIRKGSTYQIAVNDF